MKTQLLVNIVSKKGHEETIALKNVIVDENGGISRRSFAEAVKKAFEIIKARNNTGVNIKRWRVVNFMLADGRIEKPKLSTINKVYFL